jgi:hypothetical protein
MAGQIEKDSSHNPSLVSPKGEKLIHRATSSRPIWEGRGIGHDRAHRKDRFQQLGVKYVSDSL